MIAIVRMVVVLSVLCGLSGFALSYLKMITATAIEEQELTYVQGPALKRVFTQAENSPIADRRSFTLASGEKVTVFPIMKGGKLVGVALENFGKGYGGPIGVMVGFNTSDDTLAGVGMTTMKETPGLGMRVADAGFTTQFMNAAAPVSLKNQGGKIDAVSGATISSAGSVEAVNKAAQAYMGLKPEIFKAWAK